MTPAEAAERQKLVDVSRSWVRTPYRNYIGKKGVGCDCAHLLVEAHAEAGLAERFAVERYNADWHHHRDEERYLSKVEEYLKRMDDVELPMIGRTGFTALPGDVLVWRIGRTFSHGAIVTRWPYVVHASLPAGIVLEESVEGSVLERKPVRTYSYWGPST